MELAFGPGMIESTRLTSSISGSADANSAADGSTVSDPLFATLLTGVVAEPPKAVPPGSATLSGTLQAMPAEQLHGLPMVASSVPGSAMDQRSMPLPSGLSLLASGHGEGLTGVPSFPAASPGSADMTSRLGSPLGFTPGSIMAPAPLSAGDGPAGPVEPSLSLLQGLPADEAQAAAPGGVPLSTVEEFARADRLSTVSPGRMADMAQAAGRPLAEMATPRTGQGSSAIDPSRMASITANSANDIELAEASGDDAAPLRPVPTSVSSLGDARPATSIAHSMTAPMPRPETELSGQTAGEETMDIVLDGEIGELPRLRDTQLQAVDRSYRQAAVLAQPAQQVGAGLQLAIQQGMDRVTVQLHPEELGAVDIELVFDSERRVSVAITVERPETLDLLAREARQIERLLQAQGMSLGSELDLATRDERSGGSDDRREWAGQQGESSRFEPDIGRTDGERVESGPITLAVQGLYDLKI